ncbi:MAG TPA: polysaccharide biosynthesis tyrosine autokinase, partial [Bryobacteraceae bacterium]
AYSRQWGIVFTGKDTAEEEKLRKLEEELAKAQVDRAGKQSAREVAISSPIDAVPQVINNARVSEYGIKIANLRRELTELTAIYSPNHYKVKLVQAQIDELVRTLKQEQSNIMSRIRNEFEAAKLRESILQAAYDAQSKRVAAQAERAVYYNLLKHEVDTNRNLYDALLQRVKEAGIASAIRSSNARVVDSAEVPKAPFKPRPVRNCALGSFTCLMLGGVLLVLRERTNNSFREPGEAAAQLDVPELGAIPNAGLPKVRRLLPLKVLSHLPLKGHAPAALNGDEPLRVELIGWQDRHSVVAECFRATLASIQYSSDDERRRPRVMMVTSSLPGEGKTTSSSNLAIAVAETGCRTLLIDADMRNPKLHSVFNVSNSGGLSELLRQQDAIEQMPVETLVHPTAVPGLSLLPSGPGTASVWQLLHSPRMAALLRVFRSEFDVVLIDSPPVLQCTDARVLARYCDGVILVLHAGRTTRDAVLACRRRFAEDRIPVLGTILNRWRPAGRPTTYYGGYQQAQDPSAA